MRQKLISDKEIIEDSAYGLWQGHGVDVNELNKAINDSVDIIIKIIEDMSEEDKMTTIHYIQNGLRDFQDAIKKRDDFLLADCLYYIWRELVCIYIEEINSFGV